MKITVIGTGYVGLVSGACLAEVGNDILCFDVDADKIAILNNGGIPIYEPGLQEIVARNQAAGRLRFTNNVEESVHHGMAQFIAVGTPPQENGSVDMQYIYSAARNIGRYMDNYKVIVNKSTVPVGTADQVQKIVSGELLARNVAHEYSVVSNPEFLKEGAAIEDFMRPHRIIVGCDDERALQIMHEIYAPFQRSRERFISMDIRSAELTKYAANAMLATRISFMNELANLAEKLGADIELVRQGIGSDPRIGNYFLYAGCGYGGSCFPKDVQAMMWAGKEHNTSLRILNAVYETNEEQKKILAQKIIKRFGSNLKGKQFAVWGLAFKPNTDDMREAPSLKLVAELLQRGATVIAYDPVAMKQAQPFFKDEKNIRYADSPMSALNGAEALVIVTEWKEFRSPDFSSMKKNLKNAIIFDGRNLYEPDLMKQYGFEYYAIGRTQVSSSSFLVSSSPIGNITNEL